MNPLTNMKNITKLSEYDLKTGAKSTWHDQYSSSAWIFVGGMPYDLTEGDIVCVFSQYGEIVNINLIRDKATGKSKGFCFICYEDQRSTVLAVDNLNGIKLVGRSIRVDHVQDYKVPKEHEKQDEEVKRLQDEGIAPKFQIPEAAIKRETREGTVTAFDGTFDDGFRLPMRLPIDRGVKEEDNLKPKKVKKEKKEKKEKKKKSKKHSSSDDESSHKRKSKKSKK